MPENLVAQLQGLDAASVLMVATPCQPPALRAPPPRDAHDRLRPCALLLDRPASHVRRSSGRGRDTCVRAAAWDFSPKGSLHLDTQPRGGCIHGGHTVSLHLSTNSNPDRSGARWAATWELASIRRAGALHPSHLPPPSAALHAACDLPRGGSGGTPRAASLATLCRSHVHTRRGPTRSDLHACMHAPIAMCAASGTVCTIVLTCVGTA